MSTTTQQKSKKNVKVNEDEQQQEYTRTRPTRRKVYERPNESAIPSEVIEHFAKDGYELRMIRWSVRGDTDYRSLNRREQEGYEFVKASELPENYVRSLRIKDTQVTKGLVTTGGDLCLMKIDKDLRRSREQYFENKAQQDLDAVDVNVLEKKGLRNVGSRSQVMFKEPSFES